MGNRLQKDRQIQVLKLLAEGNSLSGTSRLTGVHLDTCTRLMVRFGKACQVLLDREMRDLEFRHLQVDELCTYCRKKLKVADADETPETRLIGEFYIFVALDEESRLIPAHWVGRRNEANTRHFAFDLASRLQMPRPHESDPHAFKRGKFRRITRISTDAFIHYKAAIDAAFGPHAEYGQINKSRMKQGKDNPQEVLQGKFETETISTSLVERNNLTTRTFMKRLMRGSISFSKKLENLRAATAMHMAHYNYCWKLKTLATTPAVAAGICGKQWTMQDLYDNVQSCAPNLIWS